MSLPNPTEDGCGGRGGGDTSNHRLRSGSGYPSHGRHSYTRSSGHHRYSNRYIGGYGNNGLDSRNYSGTGKSNAIGTCTTFGMGNGSQGAGCCNQAKSASGNTGGKNGSGCASPEGCRCVNLDDPQKVFKLVLQAIRHINDGEGATPVEIHCYMRKHHRMPDDEDKLMQIVKDSLKRGICIGCLRRRYCDGKYYISQKSSGRCKRKPPTCVTKDPPPCKKSTKKTGSKKSKKPKPKKKCGAKPKPKGSSKKGGCKKPKTKKKCPKKVKPKCPPKKAKRKCPPVKAKGKAKCAPKSKPKCPKPSESPADCPKKNKCSLFPGLTIWPNFEMKAVNKLDRIWDNIPPPVW